MAQIDDLRASIRITGQYNRSDILSRSAVAFRPREDEYNNNEEIGNTGLSQVQEERRSIELSRQNSLMQSFNQDQTQIRKSK